MSGVNWWVRRASADDYDDVISILQDGEYQGDYLSDYFHILIKSPLCYPYVCLVDDKIIAFVQIVIIDNGETASYRSGRVRRDFRGLNLHDQFTDFTLEDLKKRTRGLKRIVFETGMQFKDVYQRLERGGYTFITARKCTFYAGSKTAVQKSIQTSQNDCSSTTLLDEKNFRKVIAAKEKYPNVFKDGRLAVDSVLYHIYQENVPLILMERTSAVISYPEVYDKTLLTFCSYFRLLNGETFCKLDIYGKIGSTVLEHMKLHLRIVLEHVTDVFTIDVRCNEDIDLIDHAMINIGTSKLPEGTYSHKGKALYERPIVTQSRL
ncbi:uncharacterized protein LOC127715011 [Mytilus californianus]|uniref:uncharacterized protein LOC127715011 n=1 Tax=Mytilus californianus TaxID=6549 RepID=UPI002246C8ED|nr:uncharacterized protein LOC127715011 [Mytilus californianus]